MSIDPGFWENRRLLLLYINSESSLRNTPNNMGTPNTTGRPSYQLVIKKNWGHHAVTNMKTDQEFRRFTDLEHCFCNLFNGIQVWLQLY